MRRSQRSSRLSPLRSALLFVAASVVGSCGGGGEPIAPSDDDSIEAQIRSLFPADPSLQGAALSQISGVRQQLASGTAALARSQALGLVEFTLAALRDARLVGGTSQSTRAATSRLVDSIYQLVGLDPPRLPEGSLGVDGVARVVGSQGGVVVTPSGAAGVDFPAGALDQPVLVTITKLPNSTTPGSGPLPTTLKQYPPYYEYATFPAVPQFGDSVRVGLCQVTDPSSPFYAPEAIHSQLRLAHQQGAGIEILVPAGVSDFLTCTAVSASASSGGTGLQRLFAHGGLGGKTKSFSPFAAVDPLSGVEPAPSISSVTRQALGNFLVDPLPPVQLPRGGRYPVVVSGSALSKVVSVSFANPLVTATIVSVTATAVRMDVVTTVAGEGNTASAALGPVSFTFGTSDSKSVSSGISIVEGPLPVVSRLVVLNGVTRLKAGVSTTVTFEGETVDAGNTEFVFIGSAGVGTFGLVRGNYQGNVVAQFSVVFTPPNTAATQELTFGVVDGSGHKVSVQIVFPVDP